MNVDSAFLQAIGSIAGPVVTLIGFILVYRQIDQVEKSTLGGAYAALYAQQESITRFFIDNPAIRPYFYGSKDIHANDPEYSKVMAISEMIADFIEHIYLHRKTLPDDIWYGWRNYVTTLYRNSPALQLHYRNNGAWYGEKVLKLLTYGDG